MLSRFCFALILCLTFNVAWATNSANHFNPDLAGFSVSVKGLTIGYREFAVFAMPGEAVAIAATDAQDHLHVSSPAGVWKSTGAGRWNWIAPKKPGHYELDIAGPDGANMLLEAFVMVSAGNVRNGKLNGYRIGHYPQHSLKGLAVYKPPEGFVEVTPALAKVHVSPHFTLGDFLCKEAGGFPKYLVLRRRLLVKLETLLGFLSHLGIPPTAVHIMSGFRTPWYNAQLGNVLYSRHTWGGAADLYISKTLDGRLISDVNHDGRDDFGDSRLLAADFDKLFRESRYDYLRGGIGSYPATSRHYPFVHVDVRGFRARW